LAGAACGCCIVAVFTVTVVTVGVDVCPAVTTDGNVATAATGPFACVDDVFSATADCARLDDGTGAAVVTTPPAAGTAAAGTDAAGTAAAGTDAAGTAAAGTDVAATAAAGTDVAGTAATGTAGGCVLAT